MQDASKKAEGVHCRASSIDDKQFESLQLTSAGSRGLVEKPAKGSHEFTWIPGTPALKLAESANDIHQQEEGSFNLLTTSFESIDAAPFSPAANSTRGSLAVDSVFSLQEDSHPTGENPPHMNESGSEYSFGDLSPIKMDYTGGSCQIAVSQVPSLTGNRLSLESVDGLSRNEFDGEAISNPYYVLRTVRKAFDVCRYCLPCLRGSESRTIHISERAHIRQHIEREETYSNSADFVIATRRIEAAICAFGGALYSSSSTRTDSIFRLTGPSSSRRRYEELLHRRYFLSGSRISWAVEENPPVDIFSEDENDVSSSGQPSSKRSRSIEVLHGQDPVYCTHRLGSSISSDEAKMKHRCKLCGQLKQNHNCPNRQLLHRSIGVMVYPAVNSFTAAEPGTIAPPLSKMNNFVSYDSDHGNPDQDHEDTLDTARRDMNVNPFLAGVCPTSVTPESLRAASSYYHSPQSSLSLHSDDASPLVAQSPITRLPKKLKASGVHLTRAKTVSSEAKNPLHSSVFVASVHLRPEHYRSVTQVSSGSNAAYHYPVVPLTFAERKRLSDTLFYLSREVPGMTDDCAVILRDARERNEWDAAVAELLTQAVVSLYCSEGDIQLEGLQKYLIALGVSC